MNEELKERLSHIATGYDRKAFHAIIELIKKNRINDDDLLNNIENISRERFLNKVRFTRSVISGNILEIILTIAGVALAFSEINYAPYFSAMILMTSLHPLSHYLAGRFTGIKFTHYYLNGPARIEPTLRIDQVSYLKADGRKRALMHASGVIGTVAAPLFPAAVAMYRGAAGVASNLFIFFLLMIVFELLTSTKTGDLMKVKREFGYK